MIGESLSQGALFSPQTQCLVSKNVILSYKRCVTPHGVLRNLSRNARRNVSLQGREGEKVFQSAVQLGNTQNVLRRWCNRGKPNSTFSNNCGNKTFEISNVMLGYLSTFAPVLQQNYETLSTTGDQVIPFVICSKTSGISRGYSFQLSCFENFHFENEAWGEISYYDVNRYVMSPLHRKSILTAGNCSDTLSK